MKYVCSKFHIMSLGRLVAQIQLVSNLYNGAQMHDGSGTVLGFYIAQAFDTATKSRGGPGKKLS